MPEITDFILGRAMQAYLIRLAPCDARQQLVGLVDFLVAHHGEFLRDNLIYDREKFRDLVDEYYEEKTNSFFTKAFMGALGWHGPSPSTGGKEFTICYETEGESDG